MYVTPLTLFIFFQPVSRQAIKSGKATFANSWSLSRTLHVYPNSYRFGDRYDRLTAISVRFECIWFIRRGTVIHVPIYTSEIFIVCQTNQHISVPNLTSFQEIIRFKSRHKAS